jgi:hypothetical protein
MEKQEFSELIENNKVTDLEFTGYEMIISFDNGEVITVSHTVEWDSPVWEFDSLEDQRKRDEAYKQRMELQAEKERLAKLEKEAALSILSPEQLEKLAKFIK